MPRAWEFSRYDFIPPAKITSTEEFFTYSGRIERADLFYAFYDEIPNNLKYEVFRDVYIMIDNTINLLRPKIVRDIFKHRNEDIIKHVQDQLTQYVDNDGFVRIYRGASDKSPTTAKAISWTLKKDVAEWFANRQKLFGQNGIVYCGKINISDIMDFLDGRNEQEVLINPRKVTILSSYQI